MRQRRQGQRTWRASAHGYSSRPPRSERDRQIDRLAIAAAMGAENVSLTPAISSERAGKKVHGAPFGIIERPPRHLAADESDVSSMREKLSVDRGVVFHGFL